MAALVVFGLIVLVTICAPLIATYVLGTTPDGILRTPDGRIATSTSRPARTTRSAPTSSDATA